MVKIQAAFVRLAKQPVFCNTRFAIMNMKYFLYLTAALFLLLLWVWRIETILLMISVCILAVISERDGKNCRKPCYTRLLAIFTISFAHDPESRFCGFPRS